MCFSTFEDFCVKYLWYFIFRSTQLSCLSQTHIVILLKDHFFWQKTCKIAHNCHKKRKNLNFYLKVGKIAWNCGKAFRVFVNKWEYWVSRSGECFYRRGSQESECCPMGELNGSVSKGARVEITKPDGEWKGIMKCSDKIRKGKWCRLWESFTSKVSGGRKSQGSI